MVTNKTTQSKKKQLKKNKQKTKQKKNNSRIKFKNISLRGGAAAAAEATMSTLKNSFESLEIEKTLLDSNKSICDKLFDKAQLLISDKPNIQELFRKFFKKTENSDATKKLFNPYLTLSIPFITDVQNSEAFTSDFYYKWYMERNPEMKPLISDDSILLDIDTYCTTPGGEHTFNIYETLLAEICRDICIFLITKRYFKGDEKDKINYEITKDNIEILSSLLQQCEECIIQRYKYFLVSHICINFIRYFGHSPKYNDTFSMYYFNSPYLFFPTSSQVSYQSIVLLTTTPIINYRLTNRIRLIHDVSQYPVEDFAHNVANHAVQSHYINDFFGSKAWGISIILDEGTEQKWFSAMNKLIMSLEKYFFIHPKDKKTVLNNVSTIHTSRKMYSFFLFCFLHEYPLFLFLIIIPYLLYTKPNPIIEDIKKEMISNLKLVAKVDRLLSIIRNINIQDDELWNNVIVYFQQTILQEHKTTDFQQSIKTLQNIAKQLKEKNGYYSSMPYINFPELNN